MRRLLFLAFGIFFPVLVFAQPADDVLLNLRTERTEFLRARVIDVSIREKEPIHGMGRFVQDVTLRIITGSNEGRELTMENTVLEGRTDMELHTGDTVVLEEWETLDGGTEYFLREQYRLPSLLILTGVFLLLAFIFGGRLGLQSVLGLGVSILILALFVVPRIIAGDNPLFIGFIGAFLIACTALYLAHGFSKKTSVALLSTLLTLLVSAILAIIFVQAASLFGLGSEEAMYLQIGPTQNINLRGLLLGGIIIGALGVLDDITTAQTATIAEIYRHNPRLKFRELYQSGTSIGREHIASLVNSLALAYVGASLPLLLLFTVNRTAPLWVILNGEFIAEEIVRTLVGSATLLFAVPISTFLAAWLIPHLSSKELAGGHVHHH